MIAAKTDLNQEAAWLLSIVEIDREDRILCQAVGCGRPIHKRIHVVLVGTEFRVLGSQCYQILYGIAGAPAQEPEYGTFEGRRLTDEERRALIENTALFIENLEAKRAEMEQIAATEAMSRQRESDARAKIREHMHRYQSTQRTWPSRHVDADNPVYDISNMLNWRWKAGASRDAVAIAYKKYPVLQQHFDVVIQCLAEKKRTSPYTFALLVEGKYFLPKGMCLEALDKLGLIEQYM